ncbi:hypothetical protein BH24PSE1_BH24PSE1_05390 [soil metagenome]
MRLLPTTAALLAFGLAACSQNGDTDSAANDMSMDQEMVVDDPATTDLNMDAGATAVDQAINQTDQQSDLQDSADDAANSVSSAAQ